jgi:hypothetical protein
VAATSANARTKTCKDRNIRLLPRPWREEARQAHRPRVDDCCLSRPVSVRFVCLSSWSKQPQGSSPLDCGKHLCARQNA